MTINSAIADCIIRRYVEYCRSTDDAVTFDTAPYAALHGAVSVGLITGVAAEYVACVERYGFESGTPLLNRMMALYY